MVPVLGANEFNNLSLTKNHVNGYFLDSDKGNGFAGMEVMDMVWRAVSCLVWQVVLVILATVSVNLVAFFKFDRKGEFRTKQ